MPLEYPAILEIGEKGQRFSYTDRDTMLYALAVGLGGNPTDEQELDFVYEKNLKVVPTLVTVVCWGAGVPTEQLGLDYKLVLHGEEHTIFHKPVPPAATLIADSSIREVYDKGEGKGAIVLRETVLREEGDDRPIATLRRTLFARGDGGLGGSKESTQPPHMHPNREPDVVLKYPTARNQAAIYRLCGDRNPLHIEPERAKAAGFDRPILHGLCTYGFTCRAVLEAFCGFDPALLASHQARFSSPVFPGETLRISLWRDGDVVSFEAEATERSAKVIRNGRSQLR
jgi:acyl dehydratase